MTAFPPLNDQVSSVVQVVGTLCQMSTALIAVAIGVATTRYTKRQNALALINRNNSLANLVNTMIVQSDAARQAMDKLNGFVVGCPDDAILMMYLNYVHDTFRMRQSRAISAQVWQDTLSSCARTMQRLRREQLQALLGRGYEAAFQAALLARHAEITAEPGDGASATRPYLAWAG